MQGTLSERITRSLAYMLRHQPEEFDLDLDDEGWGEMEEVVCALNERLGEPIEEEDVIEALEGGDRQRYEVDGDRIRALYGHSFYVEPGEPTEPPETLYVGVGSRDAAKAEEVGLKPGRRSFVHLSLTEEDAIEAGRRAAPEYVVITVDAAEAWEEGIEFYDRISLFLSEEIPADFLEFSEVHTDGIRRMRTGRGRPERGSGGGRRGRERGRGRGRGRTWDRDRDDEPREERSRDRDEDRPRRREAAPEERPERPGRPERVEASEPQAAPAPVQASAKRPAPSESEGPGDGAGFGAGLS